MRGVLVIFMAAAESISPASYPVEYIVLESDDANIVFVMVRVVVMVVVVI